jgi:cytochrome c oxidase subunit 2
MIMPQQWAWKFRYAGNDGIFNTADDVITTNEMKIPRALPILIQMKSKDVIHGLFIPNARIQMDAIPGQVSKMWFDAHRTGIYEIACYHMCGTAHYKMKAFLDVMEENDFNDWVKEKSNWAAAAYDAEDKAVHWGWDWGI